MMLEVKLILFIYLIVYKCVKYSCDEKYSMKNGVKRHVSLLKEKVAKFLFERNNVYMIPQICGLAI